MVEKRYDWVNGAKLEDHSRRKHKILQEYFSNYLAVRCTIPQQRRFRLAIVDGFAGGGRYECGEPGSPLIFLKALKRTTAEINNRRVAQGLGKIEIECLFIFNDLDINAINLLQDHIAPLHANIINTCPPLHVHVEYLNESFEIAYKKINAMLTKGRYRNVLFNLDQCGDTHVKRETILDIMRTHPSVEIFYTFMINSLLTFLQRNDPDQLHRRLAHLGLTLQDIKPLTGEMSRNQWLGNAERIVFDRFRSCAPFVSPFSIKNPSGWRYWLIHLANSYRARQVYNNVLHENASLQAHFGRSGLNMLSYDPRHQEGSLYLFDDDGRRKAKEQLMPDISRLVSEIGDVVPIADFYEAIYNDTPAHMDDIHSAIVLNPDLEVITPKGAQRRSPNSIRLEDYIRLKMQRSFFPMFLDHTQKKDGQAN